MSRVRTIARNDFRHALEDRLVWGSVLLLAVMFLPSVGAVSPSSTGLYEHVLTMMADLIPFSLVVFVAIGYNSITGERAEGIVRLVLGLSGTRRDVVLGKFLSRLSIVFIALGLVLVVAFVQTVRVFGTRSLLPFWVMGGWMFVYGVVWTAITIGYSAAFSSQYRALGALVGTYAVFTPALAFWGTFVHPLFAVAFTGSPSLPKVETLADAPAWMQVMFRLNPIQGFAGMVQWSVSITTGRTPELGFGVNLVGITVFLALGIVVLLVGMRRFRRADLDYDTSGPDGGNRLASIVPVGPEAGGNCIPGFSSGDRTRVWTIVRADLDRALKNWVIQGVFVLFLLVILPEIWQTVRLTISGRFISLLSDSIAYTFFLPVLVLGTATGYRSVAGERESSTVRYVLGLPATRRDLVVGKSIARVGIVVAAILVVLILAEVIALIRLGAPHLASFLVGAGWVLLVGVVWTTFVVGVSSAVSSGYRSIAVILGVYLLFSTDNGLWGAVVRPSMGLLVDGRFSTPKSVHTTNQLGPVWFRYMDGLNPFVALRRVLQAMQATNGNPSATPVFLVLYSLFIITVFVGGSYHLGYSRFVRTDLG